MNPNSIPSAGTKADSSTELMLQRPAKLLPNPMLNAGVASGVWSNGKIDFVFNGIEYFIEVVKVKRYERCLNFIGLKIGFSNYVFVKKITFGYKNQSVFVEKNYSQKYSFVKAFFTFLEQSLKEIINENDILTFFAVGDSRRKIFNSILEKNGWSKNNECYFKKVKSQKLHRQINMWGVMYDSTYKLSNTQSGSTCI